VASHRLCACVDRDNRRFGPAPWCRGLPRTDRVGTLDTVERQRRSPGRSGASRSRACAAIVCGAIAAGGCHATPSTQATRSSAPEAKSPVPRDGASPEPSRGSSARAAAATPEVSCLTVRDQELACDRTCDDIQPVLRACRDRGASGTIAVHWRWDGTYTTTRLDLRGSGLEAPAACVERAFARFVPCTGEPNGTFPLIFSGG